MVLWDLVNGERLGSLKAHESGVQCIGNIALTPSKSASWSSFWVRANNSTPLSTIVSCSFPRIGEHITAPRNTCAIVWGVQDYYREIVELTRLQGHEFATEFVHTIPEQHYIVTCDSSQEFRLWNDEYRCVQKFRLGGHARFFYWCADRVLTFKDAQGVDSAMQLVPARKEKYPVIQLIWNPVMSCIVSCSKERVSIWNLVSREQTVILQLTLPRDAEITACCLDDRQRKLFVGDERGHITVFNLMNGARMKLLDPFKGPVTSLSFIAQDRLVVATFGTAGIVIYDENSIVGYVPLTHSSVLRSIHIADSHSHIYDVQCSSTSFHMKQTAVFCEGKNDNDHIVVIDFEFGTLCGFCPMPNDAKRLMLRFVDNTSILIGVDATTIVAWDTSENDANHVFRVLHQISVNPRIVTALEVQVREDALLVLVGDEKGTISQIRIPVDSHLLNCPPVRLNHYRGKRILETTVLVDRDSDVVDPCSENPEILWELSTESCVSTISVNQDSIVFVGHANGTIRIINAHNGSLCGTFDVFEDKAMPEISLLTKATEKFLAERQKLLPKKIVEAVESNLRTPKQKLRLIPLKISTPPTRTPEEAMNHLIQRITSKNNSLREE